MIFLRKSFSLLLVCFLLNGCLTLGGEELSKKTEELYTAPNSGWGKTYYYTLGIPVNTIRLAGYVIGGFPVALLHDIQAFFWAMTHPLQPEQDSDPFLVWWKNPVLLFDSD